MMIDNRGHVYITVRLNCGVATRCRPEVFYTCQHVLQDLDNDLQECFRVLPRSVHHLIRRTNIWLNYSYEYGPVDQPRTLNHVTTHHSENWLICTKDMPEKALGIEIYDCLEYQTMRRYWNGCGLILHELCHLIHQLVLTDGLYNALVKETFSCAVRSYKYEKVLRRDWADLSCDTDKAYATVNHKEFFAELSVTFLSKGYTSLDKEVENCNMKLCSPPALDLLVFQSGNGKLWDTLINILCFNRNTRQYHCNKFFPFTRGQLQQYDPKTFSNLKKIWQEISVWKDPDAPNLCHFPFKMEWCCSRKQVLAQQNDSFSGDNGYYSLSDSDFPDSVSL